MGMRLPAYNAPAKKSIEISLPWHSSTIPICASLPQSKAWEIVARARHLSSLRVLTYSQVSQLMVSLNWASGLIPLGRLYLRPLQRHFHSLGLTNRFTPPRQSDPLVLANLLRQWQDLHFLTSGIQIRTFQADFTIFTDASTQGWGAHMGDSKISGIWTRTDRKLHINCLELKAVISALQHWAPVLQGHQVMVATDNSTVVSYINKQGETRSPNLVALDSQASPLVRGSEHNSPSKTHSRLSERDSRPPISSESANIDRVVPPPRDRETNLQALGDTRSRRVCNSVELPPSSVHVSNSGATSPRGGCFVSGLAGEVNVHVSSIPPAQQIIQKLRSTQAAEVILIAPWWPNRSWFPHLLPLCVEHPLCFPYRPDLLSQQDQKYVSDGKSYHLHAWNLSCDTIKQQAFQTRSLGSQQPLGGFASHNGPQGKGLIRLIPQLLR